MNYKTANSCSRLSVTENEILSFGLRQETSSNVTSDWQKLVTTFYVPSTTEWIRLIAD
jgi:hypothetical protein